MISKYTVCGIGICMILVVLPVVATTPDQEFVKAHEWMYTQGMTVYVSIDAYRPDDRVTREQAAKFFVEFDRQIMGRQAETKMYCVYSDEWLFDSTLVGSIQSACNRGLMLWSQWVFWSADPLTKAQALTILIRVLDGVQDETVSPRWKNYYTLAQQKGLTKEKDVWALDRPVTRYELALLLRRVNNPVSDQGEGIEMNEIFDLLMQLWLQTK